MPIDLVFRQWHSFVTSWSLRGWSRRSVLEAGIDLLQDRHPQIRVQFRLFFIGTVPGTLSAPLIRSPGTLSAPGRGPRINLVLVSRVSGRHYDGDGKVSQVPVKPA